MSSFLIAAAAAATADSVDGNSKVARFLKTVQQLHFPPERLNGVFVHLCSAVQCSAVQRTRSQFITFAF